MGIEDKNSWEVWSKHILKELERLNANYETMSKELTEVKEEIASLKNQQTTIGELKEWKKELESEITPRQLRDLKAEVKALNSFKTVSTTIWLVIQVLFGLALAFKDKLFP